MKSEVRAGLSFWGDGVVTKRNLNNGSLQVIYQGVVKLWAWPRPAILGSGDAARKTQWACTPATTTQTQHEAKGQCGGGSIREGCSCLTHTRALPCPARRLQHELAPVVPISGQRKSRHP